jgi:hypothetical protein
MNRDEANRPVAGAQEVVEQEFPKGVGFTEVEWRRLAFLRWLYRTGRLTEWAEGGPGR